MWRIRPIVVAAACSCLIPAIGSAQTKPVPLSSLLPQLYIDALAPEVVALKIVLGGNVEFGSLAAPALIPVLLGNQIPSFPLGSASGGFAWTFDPVSGAFVRASDSFGPVFAERALTIGKKRLNAGVNYQHVKFDHFFGRSLTGGQIVTYTGVVDRGLFFANALDLSVTTDTLNAFATYGLTDSLDLGVAVPVSRVHMDASLTARIGDTTSGISNLAPFVTSRSGTASGIGDVVIRAKYHMLKLGGGGLAETIDVRLPTGDETNLLGVAGPQVKLVFIASSAIGRFSPHLNIGYTISGSTASVDNPDLFLVAPPEEINYAGGADAALSPRTTVAFDVFGRVLRGTPILTQGPGAFGSRFPEFQIGRGDLNLPLGSVGVKINPFGNMLLTGNVLFPLSDNGLTAKLTWMAGVDYSF